MPIFNRPFAASLLRSAGCCLLVLSIGVLGCGSPSNGPDKPRGGVVITVTYDGQPVTEGRVDLSHPSSGEGGGGELDSDGVVRIDGVAHGQYTVTVIPPPADPKPPESGQAPPPVKEYPNIPAQFRLSSSSPLKAEVKEGTSEFKFELKE